MFLFDVVLDVVGFFCVCAVDKCETDVKMEQSNERILKVLLVNRLMKIETSNR